MSGEWTAKLVEERLMEAGDVYQRMPMQRWSVPERLKAHWPAETLTEFCDLIGIERRPKVIQVRPNPEQISRADEAIWWLLWVSPKKNRLVVAARSFGCSWSMIEKVDGRTRAYLRRGVMAKACDGIACKLNQKKVQIRGLHSAQF